MEDFEKLPKMASWDDRHNLSVPTSQLTFAKPVQNHKFIFHQPSESGFRMGKEIGSLDFNGPEMKFEGNAEESAKVFFDYLAKQFQERLKEEYQRGYNDAKKENA